MVTIRCNDAYACSGEVGWFAVWVLWLFNLCRLFNAKSIFMKIVSSISNYSVEHEYILIVQNISISNYSGYSNSSNQLIQFSMSTDFVYSQLNVKTVLY